jgi:hypothetical protein
MAGTMLADRSIKQTLLLLSFPLPSRRSLPSSSPHSRTGENLRLDCLDSVHFWGGWDERGEGGEEEEAVEEKRGKRVNEMAKKKEKTRPLRSLSFSSQPLFHFDGARFFSIAPFCLQKRTHKVRSTRSTRKRRKEEKKRRHLLFF